MTFEMQATKSRMVGQSLSPTRAWERLRLARRD